MTGVTNAQCAPRHQIDFHAEQPVFIRQLQHLTFWTMAGTVDHHIDPAERGQRCRHPCFGRVQVARFVRQQQYPRALGKDRRQQRRIAHPERQAVTTRQQFVCNGKTDTARSAGIRATFP